MLASAGAQTTVATNPVGFTTLAITPQSGSTVGYTFISLNMVRPATYRALVPTGGAVTTSNGVTALVFPSGTFTANQFNGTGNASYIELTNGTTAGLTASVTATSASDSTQGGAATITLDQNITSAITAGTTTFLVRPHWTFGTAFGPTNSAGFLGSVTPSRADSILILDPNTGASTNYYFSTSNNTWTSSGADATNAIIPPNAGLYIQRKATASLSVQVVGEVKLGQTGLGIVGGSSPSNISLIPNPYPLDSVSLANSNLYTGNAATGLVGSVTPSNADNLGILDTSTGAIANYYYNTTHSRWENSGNDASAVTIPSGSSVLITRKNNRPTFIWYVPQPAMNL